MMNILQVQDALKGLPMDALVREMQMPSGQAPQFLILSEIARRKKMEQEAQQPAPTTTVAQDAVTAAGVPQGGIADIARSMAPKSDVAQNTGIAQRSMQPPPEPQMMASGGYVQKMQPGGPVVRNGMVMAPEYPINGTREEKAAWQAAYGMTHNWDGYPKNTRGQPSVGRDMEAIQSQFDQPEDVTTLDIFEPALSAVAPVTDAQGGRTWGQRNIGDPLRELFKPVGDAGKEIGAAFMEDAPRFQLGGIPMDVPETPAQLSREPGAYTSPGARQPMLSEATGDYQRMMGAQALFPQPDFYTPEEIAGNEAVAAERQAALDAERAATARKNAEAAAAAGQTDLAARLSAEAEALDAQAGASETVAAEANAAVPFAPTDMPMDTGTPLSIPDAGIAGLMPPASAGAATAAGAAGGVGGAGGSPFEKELMDMLARREKAAAQDKWLALAQAGMALMASKQPTFGGALGEAGLAGLEQLQSGRAQYDKDRLGLLSALESAKLARAKLAADKTGMLTPYQAASLAASGRSDAAKELRDLIELRKGIEDLDGNPLPNKVAQWDSFTAQINRLITELYGAGSAEGGGGVDYVVSGARTGG